MKIVIFGLTISSSWGNGHATLWRGLCKALIASGHTVEFYERDVAYYAATRDLDEELRINLVLYGDWPQVRQVAGDSLRDADVVIITSYCADAIAANELACSIGRSLRVFYDLDTPVTLARLQQGDQVDYIGPRGLADYDLVLSFTGGGALEALVHRLAARRVEALYGHVDPAVHRPAAPREHYRADLSYLGTFAADRQATLDRLLVKPARARPDSRFVIGGAQYPEDFPWSPNIYFVRHLPPAEHAAFFSSSRVTLNVTRRAMAEMGWCPSGRLFEAAACETATISDYWDGLEDFFTPGSEVLVATDDDDVLAALDSDHAEIARLARRARERVLDQHTSAHRARELCAILERSSRAAPALEATEV
jgi:spore maturation protein CgeB